MTVTELITSIGVLGTLAVAIFNIRQVKAVKHEVKTMNESTIGELGAADEARRIRDIPADQRTPKEDRHIVAADEERRKS